MPKLRGDCPVCLRECHIRANGKVNAHRAPGPRSSRLVGALCDGSGRNPAYGHTWAV